ncbi:MAG: UDP-N-acetylmuramoyl-L-alanyl-D-glutamate--2,6-diaminopimelate ligase [Bacteroidota bacterium]
MKNLEEICASVAILKVTGPLNKEIENIERDSRKALETDVFVAIIGTKVDGHQFIDVVKANTVVCEVMPAEIHADKTYILVEDTAKAWAELSAAYFGYPASELTVVGVTGTNGKTSVATLLYNLFQQIGVSSGLISTIEYRIGEEVLQASHTTPDSKILHGLFAKMVEAGCSHVFMEVSSHALVQHRVHGVPFDMAIFTNITHDHLNYHGTFSAYIQAKKILFDTLSSDAVALVNSDDRNAKVMVQNSSASIKTFALRKVADYEAKIVENTLEGLYLRIASYEVWFRLLGSFNAYNLLTAYAVSVELGFDNQEILKHLSLLEGVAGRFEVVRAPHTRLLGIVDYSHTPDSLKNALQTLQDIHGNQGEIITVVGCGGDRDTAKRPLMGKIAAELSNRAILTSDNPRSEAPEEIIAQMYEGINPTLKKRVLRIPDRREAIFLACSIAQSHDVILIAGKGHETYQEINGKRFPFDDKKVYLEALQELK